MRINKYNTCKLFWINAANNFDKHIWIYKNECITFIFSSKGQHFCKFMLKKVDTSLLGCSVLYLVHLNCNEMVLSNTKRHLSNNILSSHATQKPGSQTRWSWCSLNVMICLVTDSTRLPVDTFIVKTIKMDIKKYLFNISII